MPTVTFAAMTDVSVKIAKLYLELHDWKASQIIMLEDRKLPQKTLAGQKRVFLIAFQNSQKSKIQAKSTVFLKILSPPSRARASSRKCTTTCISPSKFQNSKTVKNQRKQSFSTMSPTSPTLKSFHGNLQHEFTPK